ncbi:MAG TPA: hypothetical protein VH063_12250 [Gaiellaceae bacterium]|jgi:heme/copper-type cytochrome/quinol oxidase subunit 2|nr:hypothetical protein [Gaiellaceae bacterium]
MLVGLTALTWVILIPATLCWPVAGFIVYLVWRSSREHEEHADAERKRLLEAAAARTASGPGGPAS